MTKMTRPVMKHLAEMNFKNWNRLDAIIGKLYDRMINASENYVFYVELRDTLRNVRDDIIFIDETFRIWLEKE